MSVGLFCVSFQQALADFREQPFDQEKLVAIYIPNDLYIDDENAPAYIRNLSVIIYEGHSIVIDSNDILLACRNTFIYGQSVYKKLPKGCQFMVEWYADNELTKYVCGSQGCIKSPYYGLVDAETGKENPLDFSKYKK
jgi:hypothetical protein